MITVATFLIEGYRYAGLQNGGECRCGNDYGSHGKAPESDCKATCLGDRRMICGHFLKNSVYRGMAGASHYSVTCVTKSANI